VRWRSKSTAWPGLAQRVLKTAPSCGRSEMVSSGEVNDPKFEPAWDPGGSISWKRVWSHGEEAKIEAVPG
jgi:hypothetical protein